MKLVIFATFLVILLAGRNSVRSRVNSEKLRTQERSLLKQTQTTQTTTNTNSNSTNSTDVIIFSGWPYWYSYAYNDCGPYVCCWTCYYWNDWWSWGYSWSGWDYYWGWYGDYWGFYDYGWGYGYLDGWGDSFYDGVGGLDIGYGESDISGAAELGGSDIGSGDVGGGVEYDGGFADRIYPKYLRRLKSSEDIDKTEKNTGKEGSTVSTISKKKQKQKREPAIEKFKSLNKLSRSDQREAVKLELAKLKFEVFGDKNYDTKDFRKSHKNEVFSTKWILRQYQVYRLVKLMKRLEKVEALKATK